MIRAIVAILFLMTALPVLAEQSIPPSLRRVHRILFLGDSITYSGQFVEYVDAVLATRFPDHLFELIDIGLPSETVSGLSEPGHAGGAFPRPDLHERLDRALVKTKPDMVVACYGMNDGIYYPLSEDRFRKYREGMEWLAGRVKQSGVKLLILTPPVFDAEPIRASTLPAGLDAYPKPYGCYDEVLSRYSKWLLDQRSRRWWVGDVHGPMRARLDRERKKNPAFRLAEDGVHPGVKGHRIIADAVLKAWRVGETKVSAGVLELASERQRILKDAWLSEIGHVRPGMTNGLPLREAMIKTEIIGPRIHAIVAPGSTPPAANH